MGLFKRHAALVALCAMLAGCTSGNSAIEPPFQGVNPLQYKLSFAVGTMNYTMPDGSGQATGLNVVTAYRQPNGDSGTLANTPTITGPASFLVPVDNNFVDGSLSDGGTNHIGGDPQTAPPGTDTTTFGQDGGVFSYGILPVNSNNQGEILSGSYAPYAEPFYVRTGGSSSSSSSGPSDQAVFLGGPPAYTNVQTGTYPSGFYGFSLGFNMFAGTTTPAGAYTLSLAVPLSPSKIGTLTATANLTNTTPLPVYPVPSFTLDGNGGGTATVAVPARVLETILEVIDFGPTSSSGACLTNSAAVYPLYYSVVDHTPGPATATITLPDNVGPPPTTGGTNPTLCPSDFFLVYALGVDYAASESGPGQPNSNGVAETPNFFLSNGPQQADITISGPGPAGSSSSGLRVRGWPHAHAPHP